MPQVDGAGHYTTEGGYLFPNAKVVRIDTQPRGLWQGLRTADLHVQADAKAAAEAIVTRLKERGISRRGWRSNEIAEKIATTAENPDPNRLRKKSVGGVSSPIRRPLRLRNPLI